MGTRKLGRPTAHRRSMLAGMAAYLIENGKIETTLTRAKEVSSVTDKLITLGKKGGLANFRKSLAMLPEETAKKLFDVVAPKFADVSGGYTAVYKLGPRRGDGAEMALITLTASTVSVAADTKSAGKADAKKPEVKAEEKSEAKTEEKAEEPVKEVSDEKAE